MTFSEHELGYLSVDVYKGLSTSSFLQSQDSGVVRLWFMTCKISENLGVYWSEGQVGTYLKHRLIHIAYHPFLIRCLQH